MPKMNYQRKLFPNGISQFCLYTYLHYWVVEVNYSNIRR